MKISYAITVCNEVEEIKRLLSFLLEHKRDQDEVVILYDQINGSEKIIEWLVPFNKRVDVQTWRGIFEKDFGEWKNLVKNHCSGDYIFHIDADEVPDLFLIENLINILEVNPTIEAFLVPRVNKVLDITPEHIEKWRWVKDERGYINWPDYQWRIWKNIKRIQWSGKIHEVLVGHKSYAYLPVDESFALCHIKTIEKQVIQNSLYDKL